MEIKLQYTPSQKLRSQYLIDTGNRLKDDFVSVEMTTLAPEQRAIIVASRSAFSDDANGDVVDWKTCIAEISPVEARLQSETA